MRILEVIQKADLFLPNNYTLEEKLSCCDYVSAVLSQSIQKVYLTISGRCGVGEVFLLPADVSFEQVEKIFVDGLEYCKVDFRSFGIEPRYDRGCWGIWFSGIRSVVGDIKLVYLQEAKAIRRRSIFGRFLVSNIGGECRIYISYPPFIVGDILSFGDSSLPVLDVTDDYIVTSPNILSDGESEYSFERIITDFTPIKSPFDQMYIDYILHMICTYQRDYEGADVHLNAYNNQLASFILWHKQRNPLDNAIRFKNYW